MTSQTLTIPARMPGLNELIDAMNRNRHAYNRMKKKWGNLVAMLARAQGFQPIVSPVHFEYEFGEPNRRRDPDNIFGGCSKIFCDALVEAGLLPDDGWEWVLSFVATWKVSEKAYVKVTVRT